MKTERELVSPEMARKWLAKNSGNRTIRQAWVAQLAGMIQRGQWAETHQGIAIGKTGRLLDGQHRLEAICKSGKTVAMLVTRGLDEDVYQHIDGGKSRQIADRIKFVDDPAVNRMIAAIVAASISCVGKNNLSYTVDQTENAFLAQSEEFIAVAEPWARRKVPHVTRCPVAAALVSYMAKHPSKAEQFMRGLLSGEGLEAGSPILLLREALINDRARTGQDQYWKTIQACRFHLEGRKMSKIQPATEDFTGNEYKRLQWARSETNTRNSNARKFGSAQVPA